MLTMMAFLSGLTKHKHGFVGFAAAASVAIAFCAILSLAIPVAGLGLFFLWTLPSLIHARANIAHLSRFIPLPWEDQFAAVIVAFIVQIPLWLTAGFLGFLLGALAFDLLTRGWSVEAASYVVVWLLTTIVVYVVLFSAMLLGTSLGTYCNDPRSKRVSIRDAKPIYHPF